MSYLSGTAIIRPVVRSGHGAYVPSPKPPKAPKSPKAPKKKKGAKKAAPWTTTFPVSRPGPVLATPTDSTFTPPSDVPVSTGGSGGGVALVPSGGDFTAPVSMAEEEAESSAKPFPLLPVLAIGALLYFMGRR